jgi:hypothetical protein
MPAWLACGRPPTWPAHSDVGSTNPTASTAWVAGIGPAPPPRLHRNRAHPSDICTGIELAPATSGPGLGSPRPYLDRDWAHPGHPSHIGTGTGLTPPASTPEVGSSRIGPTPQQRSERARCTSAGRGLRQLGRSQPRTRARQPLCRRGRGEPGPGADVAGVSPVPVQMWRGADAA